MLPHLGWEEERCGKEARGSGKRAAGCGKEWIPNIVVVMNRIRVGEFNWVEWKMSAAVPQYTLGSTPLAVSGDQQHTQKRLERHTQADDLIFELLWFYFALN